MEKHKIQKKWSRAKEFCDNEHPLAWIEHFLGQKIHNSGKGSLGSKLNHTNTHTQEET